MNRFDAWMDLAIAAAREAAADGEVPVGALVVRDDAILGRGRNRTEQLDDPSAHAEILALREAGRATGDWRLDGATLVVTLEPCPMCLGAILLARVERLVFGASDPRYGACGSALSLPDPPLTPHLKEIRSGVLAEPCGELLREFFRELRERPRDEGGHRPDGGGDAA